SFNRVWLSRQEVETPGPANRQGDDGDGRRVGLARGTAVNRRIVNQLIVCRALAEPQAPGLARLVVCLQEILNHNLLLLARGAAASEKDAEELALLAAQVALDRIASGSMYRDTLTYEVQVLLPDA